MDDSRIIVFDTTLRDGEQSPGAALTIKQKIEIALALELLGVDVIEAGFPASSAQDTKSIQEISKVVKNTILCSLSRSIRSDIMASVAALKYAIHPRLHVFISTSDTHVKYQLMKTREGVLACIKDCVTLACRYVEDVEWSAMDASRTETDFLLKAIETAIKCGAKTINIPDTVGYLTPEEMSALIKDIKNRVPNIDKAIISVHCHNDLGLAVANTLACLNAGARQFEATINGIGERAGNAALEEIVMAINTRNTCYPYSTGIDTNRFLEVSKLVSKATGFIVQKNKAVVGENAFLHASGIHQDCILKHQNTIEIFDPSLVGFKDNKIVLSRHSGRAALKKELESLSVTLSDSHFEKLFILFKKNTENKKIVTREALLGLVSKVKKSC